MKSLNCFSLSSFSPRENRLISKGEIPGDDYGPGHAASRRTDEIIRKGLEGGKVLPGAEKREADRAAARKSLSALQGALGPVDKKRVEEAKKKRTERLAAKGEYDLSHGKDTPEARALKAERAAKAAQKQADEWLAKHGKEKSSAAAPRVEMGNNPVVVAQERVRDAERRAQLAAEKERMLADARDETEVIDLFTRRFGPMSREQQERVMANYRRQRAERPQAVAKESSEQKPKVRVSKAEKQERQEVAKTIQGLRKSDPKAYAKFEKAYPKSRDWHRLAAFEKNWLKDYNARQEFESEAATAKEAKAKERADVFAARHLYKGGKHEFAPTVIEGGVNGPDETIAMADENPDKK
ncbi:MAG: hypothetical protein V1760_01090 [Candidatus Peregrinibacteria bacterium]